MSDLQRYIAARRRRDPEFDAGFDSGFEQFKLGVMLREAREGLGYVLGHRYLRAIAGTTAVSNFASMIAFAIFRSYLSRYM